MQSRRALQRKLPGSVRVSNAYSSDVMNFRTESNKRKVSLGGKSRVAETREEVLRRTHAEREKRARERLELKSALLIQVTSLLVFHGSPLCSSY